MGPRARFAAARQPWAHTPYGLEFSPDGKTFFTGLANGEVRLWDAATLTPLGDPIPNRRRHCQGDSSAPTANHS